MMYGEFILNYLAQVYFHHHHRHYGKMSQNVSTDEEF